MIKKLIGLIIVACLSVSFVHAQNINGHWKGRALDQYDVNYDFKVQADTLTGKDYHYDGTVSDISNGKIAGDSISYDVPIQGTMTHVTGKLNGDVLTISFSVQGYDIAVDLKKTPQ